jgi:hypothetical protein
MVEALPRLARQDWLVSLEVHPDFLQATFYPDAYVIFA